MKHLIITIDILVIEKFGELTEEEAKEAGKQAYIAARESLPHWTNYDLENLTIKIEL